MPLLLPLWPCHKERHIFTPTKARPLRQVCSVLGLALLYAAMSACPYIESSAQNSESSIRVNFAGEVRVEEEPVLCKGRPSAAGRRQNAADSQAEGQRAEEALQPRQGPAEPQGPPKGKDSAAVLSRVRRHT